MNNPSLPQTISSAWSHFANVCVATYHRYGNWLVSITWWRFMGLALVLMIAMGILHDLPPFSWSYIVEAPHQQGLPKPPQTPKARAQAPIDNSPQSGKDGIDIVVDGQGVRVTAIPAAPVAPASPAQAASSAAMAEKADVPPIPPIPPFPEVHIKLPPGANNEAVREAIQDAKRDIEAAMEEVRQEAKEAAEGAADALNMRVTTHKYGESLMPLTMWFILLSGILKITYKGKVQAEAKAAQATEVAESESLKRQVIEARMAAMQAQVEPHFLFNTLASIDHLIETDPPRASIMQKNLIALLRASMPTMREANAQGTRDLGKELAVIRPYLEILKVRMEERLQTDVRVSDGLLSAEFPPMMLQSLVENAIKHGLEPKAEGGQLTVSAEIVHGKLAVTVADTGLGFGVAAIAGTGIGLSNIRERLALLYGGKASLTVAETVGGGTSVTITVPYVLRTEA